MRRQLLEILAGHMMWGGRRHHVVIHHVITYCFFGVGPAMLFRLWPLLCFRLWHRHVFSALAPVVFRAGGGQNPIVFTASLY